jgi:hypothetical protein
MQQACLFRIDSYRNKFWVIFFLHMQQACLFRIDSYRNKFWVIFFLHWESIKSTSYETFLILKRLIHVYKKVSNAPYSMTNKKHG